MTDASSMFALYRYFGLLLGILVILPAANVSSAEAQQSGPDQNKALRFASERGLEIYQRDRAALLATDAAFAVGLKKTNARGWITVRTKAGWLVRFVAPCKQQLCSVVDVQLKGNRPKAVLVRPPAPLSKQQQKAWKARQLAASTRFARCSKTYNIVVIPSDGNLVVYLLAATTKRDAVILTGHRRVTVAGDGTKIIKNEALSKSCLTKTRGDGFAAMMVTHVLDPYPIETHVFTSLQYKLPIYVGTAKGTFSVDGIKVKPLK